MRNINITNRTELRKILHQDYNQRDGKWWLVENKHLRSVVKFKDYVIQLLPLVCTLQPTFLKSRLQRHRAYVTEPHFWSQFFLQNIFWVGKQHRGHELICSFYTRWRVSACRYFQRKKEVKNVDYMLILLRSN